MEIRLHANATTTPQQRAYIQRSLRPAAELAMEMGVSETTVRRWRARDTVRDRPHPPHRLVHDPEPAARIRGGRAAQAPVVAAG